MTDQITGRGAGPGEPAKPVGAAGRGTLAAYARLAKLDVYDYYIGLPLVWTLLAPSSRWEPGVIGLLVLIALAEVAVVAAMVGFDDITGYRDGSDAANYGADAARRRLARKPLVAGTLTEAQALRFAWSATAFGVVLWGLVVAVAPHRPPWALALAAVCVAASVQYSWGLKISYRGFQEIFLIGLGIGWVLVPYGLLTGEVTGLVLVQALLFGFGPMLFGLYSNTNDIDGDRRAGRVTVAALVPAGVNTAFIITMTAAASLLIIVGPLTGATPWWFPIVLTPVLAMRATHLVIGSALGDILRARRIAIRAHRVTVILLAAANLAAPLLAGIAT